MVHSPSWEANWFAASQEIPRISRNPKVHYRTHRRPPPVSILDHPNPVHIPTSHLLEIRPNIIHPSTPTSPQWFLSSGFPTKTLYTPSPHPYAPHAQPISFFSILSPHNIGRGVQISHKIVWHRNLRFAFWVLNKKYKYWVIIFNIWYLETRIFVVTRIVIRPVNYVLNIVWKSEIIQYFKGLTIWSYVIIWTLYLLDRASLW